MRAGADHIGFLGSDDARDFEELLGELLAGTRARCALLIDRAGRLMSRAGSTAGVDTTAFASLASAEFAASNQLAGLLGESEFASLYHHGRDRSLFVADVGGAVILAVLFDSRTSLGLVRIRTRKLLPVIAGRVARLAEHGPSGDVVHMEAGWAAEVETEIDRLFNG
jgi:predicted regulator of Ras-like GTPase activity (Roadblock/LC7/MglB family)